MTLLFLLIFPLAVSMVLLLTRIPSARVIALMAAVLELAVSLVLVTQFDKTGGVQFSTAVAWMPALGISFSIGADGISLLLVLLTTVLVPFIILTSFTSVDARPASFYGLILLMQAALIGVFVALDGFLFYIFWELALIPIWFICLYWGGDDRGRITLKFFIYTLTGSLLMLVSLLYLYFHTPGEHTFAIAALYEAGRGLPDNVQAIIFWGLFAAFAIKMPIFPFHTWQPDTYTVAPVQGTMLLSGIMLKMGIYGVIRWLIPVVPHGVQAWGHTAIILSGIGIVYASLLAIVQRDFKRLVAYSSIAHVGLIAAGLFTLSPVGMQGAMVQMISHGIVVVALFYIVEIISTRSRTRLFDELGGIRTSAPILASVFLVVTMGSVALPFTSGFVGEFMLINALVRYQVIVGALAGLTIILGAWYMLRAFQRTMTGEATVNTSAFTDLTAKEKWVLFPLAILIVLMGVHPAPLLELSEGAVNSILHIYNTYTAAQ